MVDQPVFPRNILWGQLLKAKFEMVKKVVEQRELPPGVHELITS